MSLDAFSELELEECQSAFAARLLRPAGGAYRLSDNNNNNNNNQDNVYGAVIMT